MPRAYSQDLREKVIQYLESGGTQHSCSLLFRLGERTVRRWWERYQKEGHTEVRKAPGSKGKVDAEALKSYVRKNPHLTLSAIGEHFGVRGVSIYQRLKCMGFKYKKKPLPMWRQMKTSAEHIKPL